MLASPCLLIPHSTHLFRLSSSLQPFPSKDGRKGFIPEKCCKKFYRAASQYPSNPTNIDKLTVFDCFVQNPDAGLPENFSVGSLVDTRTLASLLKSCSNIQEVKLMHAITFRILDEPEVYVGNNLITSYLRFSDLDHARKVFDLMSDRNVVSWTVMLNGYLKMGLNEEVSRLFEELIESGIQCNSLTFVCMLKLCGSRLDFELGRQIHACVVKGSWSNLIVDSALLYLYAQCGDFVSASRIFDSIHTKDTVCWTSMITAYARHGHGNEAFLMFSKMQDNGVCANEFTICGVLKACGEEKDLIFGKQLHSAVAKGLFVEDVHIGSSLVCMYAKCGEMADARVVFDLMPRRNTISWTSMIAGYAQNGCGEEAILLFQRMKTRRIFANNSTIVSVLSACGSIGSLSLGKEVHAQILKNFVRKNVHIGSTLVWFYGKCGEHTYATRVLQDMPVRDVFSWTAIISGFAKLGNGREALEFLNKMLRDGVEPNPFTYSSALKACAKLEDIRHGKWIHASANKTRAFSNVFVGSALIDMYMKCGCIKDASKVFKIMPERNLVSWKTMIVGYAKNGRCREALKLMYRMETEGFKVDDFVLSTVLSSCADVQWELEASSTASCSCSS